jgi:GR25 family glycosyltransferase involved in LPS biosynthesis
MNLFSSSLRFIALILLLNVFIYHSYRNTTRSKVNLPSFKARNSSCRLLHNLKNSKLVDIYWINLDSSADRRLMMQNYFQYYGLTNNYRIRAVTPQQVIVPSELSKPQWCKRLAPTQITTELKKINDEQVNLTQSLYAASPRIRQRFNQHLQLQPHLHPSLNKTVLVTGLCGRPKNSAKELVVTISHLSALHKAVVSHSNHLQEYILVLEDDLQFAMEINFEELIALAPKDFIILQLVTSNFYIINHLFQKTFIEKNILFLKRKENDDFWCAGAYLIHRKRFLNLFPIHSPFPVNDPLKVSKFSGEQQSLATTSVTVNQTNNVFMKYSEKLFAVNIVAGYQRFGCVPAECCNSTTNKFLTNYENASTVCVKSPRGFQADNFIFALAMENTYILTVPLLVNTKVGNISTLHQEHVSIHHLAFNQTKQIIKELFLYGSAYQQQRSQLSFVNPFCMLNFSSEVII